MVSDIFQQVSCPVLSCCPGWCLLADLTIPLPYSRGDVITRHSMKWHRTLEACYSPLSCFFLSSKHPYQPQFPLIFSSTNICIDYSKLRHLCSPTHLLLNCCLHQHSPPPAASPAAPWIALLQQPPDIGQLVYLFFFFYKTPKSPHVSVIGSPAIPFLQLHPFTLLCCLQRLSSLHCWGTAQCLAWVLEGLCNGKQYEKNVNCEILWTVYWRF